MALRPAFVVTALAACSPAREIPPGNPPVPVPAYTPSAAPDDARLPIPAPSAVPTIAAQDDAAQATDDETDGETDGAVTTPPASASGALNPRDGEGRTIHRAFQGDGCFVVLPFPPLGNGETRVPGAAPPTREAPCPPRLLDPAYDTCRGGVIRHKDAGCECFVAANPPRIRPHACPTRG